MTHSIDAPLPPPTTTTGPGATAPTSTGSPSTKDVAAGEAKNVGQTAAQAGSQVASTAADQAKEVAHETQRQAKDLLDQGRTQVKSQLVSQQQKAGQGLSSLAQELRGLADGSSSGAPGPARDLLQQASGIVDSFANRLQNSEPADLLEEVRSFARRKPGLFLLGAAAAGVLAGRLTSGVKAAHTSDSSSSGSNGQYRAQTNYVDPAPTYSSYDATPGYTAGTEHTSGAGYTTGSEYTTAGTGYTGSAAPLPPPPYGTVPPAGTSLPPASSAGWDDPSRRPGGVG
jgi:uncharacterized phage infection (PIP) family protein YhgE